jgi:hypothetical protein
MFQTTNYIFLSFNIQILLVDNWFQFMMQHCILVTKCIVDCVTRLLNECQDSNDKTKLQYVNKLFLYF